jgi:hypothetical protein
VTAVAEEDGPVHFFDDIYGHDKRLNALLVKGPLVHKRPYEVVKAQSFPARIPGLKISIAVIAGA